MFFFRKYLKLGIRLDGIFHCALFHRNTIHCWPFRIDFVCNQVLLSVHHVWICQEVLLYKEQKDDMLHVYDSGIRRSATICNRNRPAPVSSARVDFEGHEVCASPVPSRGVPVTIINFHRSFFLMYFLFLSLVQ